MSCQYICNEMQGVYFHTCSNGELWFRRQVMWKSTAVPDSKASTVSVVMATRAQKHSTGTLV
jgi:hypothetical protein